MKCALYLAFVNNSVNFVEGNIFIKNADHNEYLDPTNNLVEYGTYFLKDKSTPYAGRLPGFIVPYIFFRVFFSEAIVINLLGSFILLLSVVATIFVFDFVKKFSGSNGTAFMAVFCGNICTFYWHWDWTIHPNSLALSVVVFIIYYFNTWMNSPRDNKYLLLLGFLVTWLFMLRGVTFMFVPLTFFFVFLVCRHSDKKFKQSVVSLALFVLPFLVVETAWLGRNYLTFKKFIPFQTAFVPGANNTNEDYSYKSKTKYSLIQLRELINTWGGDNFWYFAKADLKWFVSENESTKAEDFFRPVIFTGTLRPSQLDSLKELVLLSFSDDLSPENREMIDKRIQFLSGSYANAFKIEHAAYYRCISPFYRLRNFVLRNVTQDWPGGGFSTNNVGQKIIKALTLFIYFASIALLMPLALISYLRKRTTKRIKLFLLLLPFALLFSFAFIINAAHYQYFIFGYLPITIFVIIFFDNSKEIQGLVGS